MALQLRPMVKIDPRTRFVIYTVTLFLATHWPALALSNTVPVSDKTIHFVAWALWLIFLAKAWNLSLGKLLLLGVLCSMVDEFSQAIPVLKRHATMMDAIANVIGVTAAWSAVVASRFQSKQILEHFWVWIGCSGVSLLCFSISWTTWAISNRLAPTMILGSLVFMISAVRIRRTES